MQNTAIVVLAAGNSTRMGSPKQLLPYGGRPLIRHAVETALASGCGPVIVVLGSRADEIRTALQELPVTLVENGAWAGGMGTSIRAGVLEAVARGCESVILSLADQPLITSDILRRLMLEWKRTDRSIVASEYAGTVGVPVLFTREHFDRLVQLKPAEGCKGVILANLDGALRIPCPEAEVDVDTPEDFRTLAKV